MAEPISKTALAAAMGVDRAQPTRWAELGMPVLPDGRVDPEVAAAWVRANIDPTMRQTRSVGAGQERTGDRNRRINATDELTRLGLWLLAQRAPGMVAELAVEVGLPIATARQMHDLARRRAAALADEVRGMMTLPAGELGPFVSINPPPLPVDWERLAALAAERGKVGRAPRSGRPASA